MLKLLDLHGNIPTFISITDGKVHDVNVLDEILPEAGAFYVMDRAYVDFERLYIFTLSAAFTGVRSDHTVILTAIDSAKAYPDPLRRVSSLDVETRKRFKFLPNNFTLPALTIAQIYKCRWQVELLSFRAAPPRAALPYFRVARGSASRLSTVPRLSWRPITMR
jgi:hypothetical protein